MSKVDLVILGLLMEEARHGYDILQQMERRDMKNWVGVSTPAIYKGLARLESKRVLRARTESGTSHPDRTVYEITPEGREYFHRLMSEALAEPEHLFLNLMTGVGFAHLEDRKVLLESLKSRCEKLRFLREHLEGHKVEMTQIKKHPITADAIIQYYMDLIDLEIEWSEKFMAQVTRIRNWPEGAYRK
jgi:DNA-binding PadR family transcriptional regulator